MSGIQISGEQEGSNFQRGGSMMSIACIQEYRYVHKRLTFKGIHGEDDREHRRRGEPQPGDEIESP